MGHAKGFTVVQMASSGRRLLLLQPEPIGELPHTTRAGLTILVPRLWFVRHRLFLEQLYAAQQTTSTALFRVVAPEVRAVRLIHR